MTKTELSEKKSARYTSVLGGRYQRLPRYARTTMAPLRSSFQYRKPQATRTLFRSLGDDYLGTDSNQSESRAFR
jgi:hypothetical protein